MLRGVDRQRRPWTAILAAALALASLAAVRSCVPGEDATSDLAGDSAVAETAHRGQSLPGGARDPSQSSLPPPRGDSMEDVAIEGIVLLPDGSLASAGVVVSLFAEEATSVEAKTVTDGSGRFRVVVRGHHDQRLLLVRAWDPVTRCVSGVHRAELAPGLTPEWVVVELRASSVLLGRVVDESGRPVPGAIARIATDALRTVHGADCLEDTVEVETDAEGKFSARLRTAPAGRAAARLPAGHLGPIRRFELEAAAPTEIGDLVIADSRVAEWVLRFSDGQGAPCADALVRMGREDLWYEKDNESFDPSSRVIHADKEGSVLLRIPCRDAPLVVGGGGFAWQTVSLSLDCSAPGRREADVRLDHRPVVLVRILGEAAPALLAAGATLKTAPLSGVPDWLTLAVETVDVLTGRPLPAVRDGDRAVPAANALERLGHLMQPERVGEDAFRLVLPAAGTYQFRLLLEGREVARSEAVIAAVPGEQSADLSLPRGRLITLDRSALLRWARDECRGSWLSRYAAWPRETRVVTRPDGVFRSARSVAGAVDLLEDAGAGASTVVRMWLADSTEAVCFGFIEDGDGPDVVVAGLTVVKAPAGGDGESTSMPVPIPRLDSVEVQRVRFMVRQGGAPLRQAGIPIFVSRVRDDGTEDETPRGCATFHTLPSGEVVGLLFAGQYVCDFSLPAVADSSGQAPTEFAVETSGEEHMVALELRNAR